MKITANDTTLWTVATEIYACSGNWMIYFKMVSDNT